MCRWNNNIAAIFDLKQQRNAATCPDLWADLCLDQEPLQMLEMLEKSQTEVTNGETRPLQK